MMMEMETETPVSINFDNDGTEKVQFDLSKMDRGKLYPFAYQGELWVLKKCQRSVSIMKFCAETGVN